MRKFRTDAKPIDIELAKELHWQGGKSLREIASLFCVHHTNLMMRFRRFGIATRPQKDAACGPPPRYGADNHAWKGGRYVDQRGYVHVRINGKNRYLHKVIAEYVLKMPLRDNWAVHHIDGDVSNNSLSNLMVCTKSHHAKIHAKQQNNKIGKYKERHNAK